MRRSEIRSPASGSARRGYPQNPRPNAAPPPIGGRFMTTNPARSKWSTNRLATISAIISSPYARAGGVLNDAPLGLEEIREAIALVSRLMRTIY